LSASCPTTLARRRSLIDFYLGSLREADRLQREFEQAAGDFLDQHGLMHEVISQARRATAAWPRRCRACL
jgi:hypothetical protein